jgi:general stress protein 26
MPIRRRQTLAAVLAIFVAAGSSQSRQVGQPAAKKFTDTELIAAAREIIAAARYCSLITLDASRRPQARTLDPFPPDEQMTIWLGTNLRSSKVREIRRNPHVVLYYFDRDAQAYVSLSGRARIVNEPKLKLKWWKDEWRDFYPDRARDYVLIQVKPERMEIVSVKRGIIGEDKSWTPPTVIFR